MYVLLHNAVDEQEINRVKCVGKSLGHKVRQNTTKFCSGSFLINVSYLDWKGDQV